MKEYLVDVFWDDETSEWGAENDEIPLILESDSLDMLIERYCNATADILAQNGQESSMYTLRFRAEKIVAPAPNS